MGSPPTKFRLAAAVLICALSAGYLKCQTPSALNTLTGSVQSPSGAAIAGAQVDLDRTDGSQVAHVLGDTSGTVHPFMEGLLPLSPRDVCNKIWNP
jgi:hypothetical protein